MADQQLNVKINLGAVGNQAKQALDEQARSAAALAKQLSYVADLQKRIAALAAMQPGANTPVGKRLAVLQEQLAQVPGYGPTAGRMGAAGPSASLNLAPAPSAVASLPPVPGDALSRTRQLLKLRAQVPEGEARDEWQEAFDAMVAQEERAKDEARRRSLRGLAQARLSGQIPASEVSYARMPEGLSEADQAEYRVRERLRREEITKRRRDAENLARARITGVIPEEEITAKAPGPGGWPGGGARAAYRMAMAAPSVTQQALDFNRPTFGNELAGVGRATSLFQTVLGGLPGPLGVAANLAGAFGQAISAIGESFKQYQPTLAEQVSLLRERQGLVGSARRTGIVSAESLRASYQGAVFGGEGTLAAMSRPNQTVQQRADVLLQARDAAQQQLEQMDPDRLARNRAQVEAGLTSMRNALRAGGEAQTMEQIRTWITGWGVQRQHEVPELESFTNRERGRTLTDDQIRQMAEAMTTGRYTQLQAQVQASNQILRGGIMPNLRPGAPQLSDLPGLFQSRQSDVLGMHEQVQMDAVRDMRQQMQHDAEVRLWEQILAAIQANRFNPVPVAQGN
ncbi:MAG: hypothetical protein KGL39_10770 [Patescibacteria group bacterium]|nr:hypothetical protein [Patescibacteria group bacterium]